MGTDVEIHMENIAKIGVIHKIVHIIHMNVDNFWLSENCKESYPHPAKSFPPKNVDNFFAKLCSHKKEISPSCRII